MILSRSARIGKTELPAWKNRDGMLGKNRREVGKL
jgi:hypothetical protein